MQSTASNKISAPLTEAGGVSKFFSRQHVKILAVVLTVIAIVAAFALAEVKYGTLSAAVILAIANPIVSLVIALLLVGVIAYLTIQIYSEPQVKQTEKLTKESEISSDNRPTDFHDSEVKDRKVKVTKNSSSQPILATSKTKNDHPQVDSVNLNTSVNTMGIEVEVVVGAKTASSRNKGESASSSSSESEAVTSTSYSKSKSTASAATEKTPTKPYDQLIYDLYPCVYENRKENNPKNDIIVVRQFTDIDKGMPKICSSLKEFIGKYSNLEPAERAKIEIYQPSINLLIRTLAKISPTTYSLELKEQFAALTNKIDYISVYNGYLELLSLKIADLSRHSELLALEIADLSMRIDNDLDESDEQGEARCQLVRLSDEYQEQLGLIDWYQEQQVDAKGCIYAIFYPWLRMEGLLENDSILIKQE